MRHTVAKRLMKQAAKEAQERTIKSPFYHSEKMLVMSGTQRWTTGSVRQIYQRLKREHRKRGGKA